MPIHLPPLTRRDFLRRSVLTGAALTLPGTSLFGADASNPEESHTWAFLSDLHISADPSKEERGVVMTENLKAVIREVLASPKRPARMFINGDCAHHTGELADYANFVSLIKPVREAGIPIDLTLGNHDHRANFLASVPGAARRPRPVAKKYVSILKTPRANWFLLDSLDVVNKAPGLLGEPQLDWLAKQLDANADKPAIVCGHHTLTDPVKDNSGIVDTEAFLGVITPRRHVKAYIFGHSHRWEITAHEGIHLINLPAVAYVFEEGQPSGWVHATLGESGLRLELRALDHRPPNNGSVRDLAWRS